MNGGTATRRHDPELALGWKGRTVVVALLVLLVVASIVTGIDIFMVAAVVSFGAVGSFLVWRRPRNPIGWILLVIAFGFVGTSTPADMDVTALAAGNGTTRDELWAWVGSWAGTAAFVAYLALTLLFPSGRFPAGRWRRPAVTMLAIAIGTVAFVALAPIQGYSPDGIVEVELSNPVITLPDLPLWDLVLATDGGVLVVLPLLVLGVVSMLDRYRRATGAVKLQLRWLITSITFMVLAVLWGLAASAAIGSETDEWWLVWGPALVAYPMLPIAIGIAVLRYRLYEIDRLISRTIGWALVTALLVGAFTLLVLGSTELLQPLTGGNTLAVAGSTLIVAALFTPLRSRVQRAVDRRFDRARYDGERLLGAFGERLRDEVDLEVIRADVLATVDAAVRPATVGLWLQERDATKP